MRTCWGWVNSASVIFFILMEDLANNFPNVPVGKKRDQIWQSAGELIEITCDQKDSRLGGGEGSGTFNNPGLRGGEERSRGERCKHVRTSR